MTVERKLRATVAALAAGVVVLGAAAADLRYRARLGRAEFRTFTNVRGERWSEQDALAHVLRVGRAVEDLQDKPLRVNPARGSPRNRFQPCLLRIMTGRHRGNVVLGRNLLQFSPAHNAHLRPGTLLRVTVCSQGEAVSRVDILKPIIRTPDVVWLVAVALLVGIAVLGLRGVALTGALSLTGAATLFVLLPLAAGRLPVIVGLAVFVLLVAVVCMLVGGGPGRKTVAAVGGAMIGLLVGGAVAWAMQWWLDFSGLENTYAVFLRDLLGKGAASFDFARLLTLAAVVTILGLTLDLGVSVASAMDHVARADLQAEPRRLLQVGLALSRDITGTMVVTLVFVWLGVNVTIFLLPWAIGVTPRELINSEAFCAQVVLVASGTIGLVLSGPATALVGMRLLGRPKSPIDDVRRQACGRKALWILLAALAAIAALLLWCGVRDIEPAGGLPIVWKWSGPAPVDMPSAEAALDEAEDRIQAGRLNAAAQTLWRVLDSDPANGRAHRDVAYVYAARGWYVLAESEIERALPALPKDSEAHYIAGTVYYERGRPDDARTHFEKALALDPTNAKAADALESFFPSATLP